MQNQLFLFSVALLVTAGGVMATQLIQEKAPNALQKETILAVQSYLGLTTAKMSQQNTKSNKQYLHHLNIFSAGYHAYSNRL